jgi:hypothetical protein
MKNMLAFALVSFGVSMAYACPDFTGVFQRAGTKDKMTFVQTRCEKISKSIIVYSSSGNGRILYAQSRTLLLDGVSHPDPEYDMFTSWTLAEDGAMYYNGKISKWVLDAAGNLQIFVPGSSVKWELYETWEKI